MPQLTANDKAHITGCVPPTPREHLFDTCLGQPLFWAERKSPVFWKQVFLDMSAKCIVDCTPGSGMAARAAMELGAFSMLLLPAIRSIRRGCRMC
jgi:hypothetical protein